MNSGISLGAAHALHVLSAIAWVGGMLFTVVVLRPALINLEPALPPPQRLAIFNAVLKRFFILVWLAVIILLVSGYWLLIFGFGGFATAPPYVHLMHLAGLVMVALFLYLYFAAYWPMKRAVADSELPVAAASLEKIRRIVQVNLVLGLLVVVIATAGRYF